MTLEEAFRPASGPHDTRVVLRGVSWEDYSALRDRFDTPAVRMTYLAGALEIMSPSKYHERMKTRVGRVLELWALESDVALDGYGSTTFRKEAVERGLEPDECYVIGDELGDVPDLAIEIVVTSGGIDKLAVYAGLGVPEVWFWIAGRIEVRVLVDGRYEARANSPLLPALDLAELARFAAREDGHAALREYRDLLRARRPAGR